MVYRSFLLCLSHLRSGYKKEKRLPEGKGFLLDFEIHNSTATLQWTFPGANFLLTGKN